MAILSEGAAATISGLDFEAYTNCSSPSPGSGTVTPSPTPSSGSTSRPGRRRRRCIAPQCRRGDTFGDPHLITLDGLKFDFQAAGEFILAKATDGSGFEVQARQFGGGNISLNRAIAARTGSKRLSVTNIIPIRIRLDGQPFSMDPSEEGTLLSEDVYIFREGDTYTIEWPTGEELSFTVQAGYGNYLNASIVVPTDRPIQGLLGNNNGDPADDLRVRNGSGLTTSISFDQLYQTFGKSWRITQAESLFDYEPGASTDSFIQNPDNIPTLTAQQRQAALAICQAANVTAVYLEDCILDVAITGQASAAQAFLGLQPPKQGIVLTSKLAQIPQGRAASAMAYQGQDLVVGYNDTPDRGNLGRVKPDGTFIPVVTGITQSISSMTLLGDRLIFSDYSSGHLNVFWKELTLQGQVIPFDPGAGLGSAPLAAVGNNIVFTGCCGRATRVTLVGQQFGYNLPFSWSDLYIPPITARGNSFYLPMDGGAVYQISLEGVVRLLATVPNSSVPIAITTMGNDVFTLINTFTSPIPKLSRIRPDGSVTQYDLPNSVTFYQGLASNGSELVASTYSNFDGGYITRILLP